MLTIVCLLHCVPDLLPERFRRNLRPAFTFADVLLLALLCMVLADPLCLYDLGVQLSFSAVAGIALCSPWLSKLWNDGPFSFSPLKALQGGISPMRAAMSRFARLLWLTLGCSVAAQLATLPLVLDAFGRSTLWFPINLLWLPALGFIVLPLSFLGLSPRQPGWNRLPLSCSIWRTSLARPFCTACAGYRRTRVWICSYPRARTGPPSSASGRLPWRWPCAYTGITSRTRRNAF